MASQKRSRNRKIISCIPCHQNKRKCDKKLPCTRCMRIGKTCSYEVSTRNTTEQDSTTSPSDDSGNQYSDGNKGYLVMGESGRSKYISGGFWNQYTSVTTKLPTQDAPKSWGTLFFDLSVRVTNSVDTKVFLTSFIPPRDHGLFLLDRYEKAVYPFVPMVSPEWIRERYIKDCIETTQVDIDCCFFSLLYAICYASAATFDEDDKLPDFMPASLRSLRQAYLVACEHSILAGGFPQDPTIGDLRACVLVQSCLVHETSRLAPVTPVAIKVAQTMGFHRDGTNYSLPPDVTESRRRLWWQLVFLDQIEAVNRDMLTSIREDEFDTRLPQEEGFMMDTLRERYSAMIVQGQVMRALYGIRPPSPGAVDNLMKEIERVRKRAERFVKLHPEGKNDFERYSIKKMLMVPDKISLLMVPYFLKIGYYQGAESLVDTGLRYANTLCDLYRTPEFKPFAWFVRSCPPYHAVSLLIIVLHQNPYHEKADQLRQAIDDSFKYCRPQGGVGWDALDDMRERLLKENQQLEGIDWKEWEFLFPSANLELFEPSSVGLNGI